MRKVLFRKWIPTSLNKNGVTETGTNCWSDFIHEGLFHQWGCSYEEFESGPGNFSIGIIELPDGTIETVYPSNLKFVNE